MNSETIHSFCLGINVLNFHEYETHLFYDASLSFFEEENMTEKPKGNDCSFLLNMEPRWAESMIH